jgi:GxxExxY protein
LIHHEEHEEKPFKMQSMNFDALSNQVIGSAIEVHRELAPGLLESTYEQRLMHELTQKNINWVAQPPRSAHCKGQNINCGYRVDLLLDNSLTVELKSVE